MGSTFKRCIQGIQISKFNLLDMRYWQYVAIFSTSVFCIIIFTPVFLRTYNRHFVFHRTVCHLFQWGLLLLLKVSLEPFLQKCQRYCRLCAVILCLKYLQNYCQFQILLVLFIIRHMKRQQQVKLLRKAELFLKKYVTF